MNLCESHGSIISIAYQLVGIMKSCRYYVPGTLNNQFLMDGCLMKQPFFM